MQEVEYARVCSWNKRDQKWERAQAEIDSQANLDRD